MTESKKCSGPCQRVLELSPENFRRDASQSKGYKPRCKKCEPRRGQRVDTVQTPDGVWHQVPRDDGSVDVELDDLFDDGLPVPAVPDGFEVRNVSSQLDADGNLEKQWLDARRESLAQETILPAMVTGQILGGVSTLLDDQGKVRAQWIKTRLDKNGVDVEKAMFEAVTHLADKWPERAVPTLAPDYCDDDLLVAYPYGDPHIGMLAWEKETGDNFDLSIAESHMFAAVDHLVNLAPRSKRAIVLTVGDTLHSDGLFNTTTRGTRVDVDGRTAKMLTVAIRTFRRIIDRALEKHEVVHVIIARGNHDELLSLVLSIALQQYYEREPRVHIDPSPQMHHWYRFGLNLIGVTHGDKAKAMDLMGVMANDRAQDWGETKHRRIYAGHIHHDVVKEVPGVIIEHLRTLASKDAWHAGMGYRSGRDMKMDVFHKVHGHINRHIVGIQQLLTAEG